MDSRLDNTPGSCGLATFEQAGVGHVSRVARPVFELLHARGGYQFVVIFLCLLSVTIGLFFHRAYGAIHLQRTELASFVETHGHQGLAALDDVLLTISSAERSRDELRHALQLSRTLARRLRHAMDEAVMVLRDGDFADGPLAATRANVAHLEALGLLARELEAETRQARDPDAAFGQLGARLHALRTAYLLFLDEAMLAEARLDLRFQDRLAVLSWLFWLCLAVGAFAGMLVFRLLRDEVAERLARERAERRADFLAYFDPATGLGNSFQFEDKLAGWIASGRRLALVLVDIDGFRQFNERFGRVSGEVVLKEVAYRLQTIVESNGGFAARLADDDFALVVPEDELERLSAIAGDVTERCRAPVTRAGQTLAITVSVGIAPYHSAADGHYLGPERLLSMARFALDDAKMIGGGASRVFDQDLVDRFLDRKTIAENLPRALAEGELQVFFQPQFDLERDAVSGFEALVRWIVDGDFVPPSVLTRIAEAEGMIGDLDRYMLENAVRTVATWNRSHRSGFSVSVNLSALNLVDAGLVEFVEACLHAYSHPAALLTLEVTESSELDHQGKGLDVIRGLRALGCKVSIDDFGTGYSSLGYLRNIEIDEVKIDRAFVADIETSSRAREFLKAIIRLPNCLDLAVIVEGVETPQQRAIARALGAQSIQGFLTGKPRPALEWLAETTYTARASAGTEGDHRKVSA